MVTDMANGSSLNEDTNTRVGILSQRTANLEGGFVDFRREVNQQFISVNAAVGSLMTKMDERFTALASAMAEKNKTQWPVIWSAIGVSGAVLAYFVTQNLAPIKETQSEIKQSIVTVVDKMVTQQEMKWRTDRGAEDRVRTDAAIADIRAGLVPRAEHERVWQNYDQRFTDEQRQIDELKSSSASTYNVRDVLLDLRNRLDALERTKP